MSRLDDHVGVALSILDANLYMVIGSVDADGRPWVSPVYYATGDHRTFYWVSSPDATHSRNISVRPLVSIVVFNSTAPVGTGQGVYMSATAKQVEGADLDRGLDIFSRRSLSHGAQVWTRDDVSGPAGLRLFQAGVTEYSILAKDGRPDRRIPISGIIDED